MPSNRAQKRPLYAGRGRGPRSQPTRRPNRKLKRLQMEKLIQREEREGDPREVPRDIDMHDAYTMDNVSKYMARDTLETALARHREGWAKRTPAASGHGSRSTSKAETDPGNKKRKQREYLEQCEKVMRRVEDWIASCGRLRSPELLGAQETIPFPQSHRVRPRCEVEIPPPPAALMDLPTEIRELILRPLLVSPVPVAVHAGWTTLYRRRQRDRPDLQAQILRTCRRLYQEGVRVLYGENHFEYLIRDATAPGPEEDAVALALGAVEEADSDGEYGDRSAREQVGFGVSANDIDVQRHGTRMRHLGLRAEANRAGPEYLRTATRAITTFATLGPVRANVHTLRVSVQCAYSDDGHEFAFAYWFVPSSPLMAALVKLPCQLVEFAIGTPAGREVVVRVDRRYGARVRRARRGDARFVLGNKALRRVREENAAREYRVLMGVAGRIEQEGQRDREAMAADESVDGSSDIWNENEGVDELSDTWNEGVDEEMPDIGDEGD